MFTGLLREGIPTKFYYCILLYINDLTCKFPDACVGDRRLRKRMGGRRKGEEGESLCLADTLSCGDAGKVSQGADR